MNRWTPWVAARWYFDVARLQLDRFLVERYGLARIFIAGAAAAVLFPLAGRATEWLNRVGSVLPKHQHTQNAWIQIIWYVAVLIVAAIVAYAMAPKPKEPEPGHSRIPEADDGKAIIDVFGEAWIEDPMVLAFKSMGEVPIKKKAGK